jgi:hypothetical protein
VRIECADKKRAEWHFCYSVLFPHCPSGYSDIVFYCLINENRRVCEGFMLFLNFPKNTVPKFYYVKGQRFLSRLGQIFLASPTLKKRQ